MLEQELLAIGLNDKEAKIYLAALELGQSTVQNIALKAGINRATTYFVIDGLMQRGLVSSFQKGKKQYFIAADPERLLEILEQEREKIEKKRENLQKILPQLQSLNNKQQGRPVVKYYEGKEGLTSMNEELLKNAKGDIIMAYSVDYLGNLFSDNERQKMRKKRLERGIKTKVLYTWSNGELESTKDGSRRKISMEKFPLTCDIAVYDNVVRIASLKDRVVGVVIEDDEIAQSFRSIFELAWEGSEKNK